MNCEVCGREIAGPGFKVKIEGAVMLACRSCQRLGKPYVEPPAALQQPARKPLLTRPARARAPELPRGLEEFDLAEDYAARIRKQRIKVNMSQEELAKRVKEKLSVIQKLETGKMAPDAKLCRELEHELRVKLLIPRTEPAAPKTSTPAQVTLGDIIRVKGKAKSEIPL